MDLVKIERIEDSMMDEKINHLEMILIVGLGHSYRDEKVFTVSGKSINRIV